MFYKVVAVVCCVVEDTQGHVVAQLIEAPRYKPEGRGVRYLMEPVGFFIDLILPAAQWPWGRLSL